MRICNKCNNTIRDDLIYCPKCGAKVVEVKRKVENNTIQNNYERKNYNKYYFVIGIIVLIILIIIFSSIGNDDKNSNSSVNNTPNKTIETTSTTTTEKKEEKPLQDADEYSNFIKELLSNSNLSKDYHILGHESDDGYSVNCQSTDSLNTYTFMFNTNKEIYFFFAFYDNSNDDSINEVYKLYSNKIFNLKSKECDRLKEIISSSKVIEEKIGNYKINTLKSGAIHFLVDDNKYIKISSSTKEKTSYESEVYELKYKTLGKYGKLVEYEGEKEYFYYFPSGNYEVEITSINDNLCSLWIDYNKGYKTEYGTAYNNKQKLKFSSIGEKHTITLSNDVHIYNSNQCNYKLKKVG